MKQNKAMQITTTKIQKKSEVLKQFLKNNDVKNVPITSYPVENN